MLIAVTGAIGAMILATGRQHEGWTFAVLALTIACLIGGLFVQLYPNVMVSTLGAANNLTVEGAASGTYTLTVMTVIAILTLPVVFGYQAVSYYVFRARVGRSQFEGGRAGGGATGRQASRHRAPPAAVPGRPAPRVRGLDRRLLERARAVRTALMADTVLGVLGAVLVLAQATLLARVIARAWGGAELGALQGELGRAGRRRRGARGAGVGVRGRRAARCGLGLKRSAHGARAPAAARRARRAGRRPQRRGRRRGRGRRRRRSRRGSRSTCRRSSSRARPAGGDRSGRRRSTCTRASIMLADACRSSACSWSSSAGTRERRTRGALAPRSSALGALPRRRPRAADAACVQPRRRRRPRAIAEVADALPAGDDGDAARRLPLRRRCSSWPRRSASRSSRSPSACGSSRATSGSQAGLTVLILAPELYAPLRGAGRPVPRQRRRDGRRRADPRRCSTSRRR